MVEVVLPLLEKANNVKWIVNVLVAMEFGLDITVSQDSELAGEMHSVGTEDLTVEGQWGSECLVCCHGFVQMGVFFASGDGSGDV